MVNPNYKERNLSIRMLDWLKMRDPRLVGHDGRNGSFRENQVRAS